MAEEIPFEQAKAAVLDALAVLGEDYTAMLREGFDHRWLDVYPNVGKRGGAYSSGIARPHPYVLLNQTDDLDSQFTIAHEMGHAMHSYLSCKHQPVCTSDYVIFVAEVASTCNEVLLMRHLLRKSTDRRERAYLINHFLDQFKGTVYRQTMFAEFERELGRMAERGETLTSDALADAIAEKLGGGHTLNFFDAAAPLVTFDSVDMDSAYFASRYDKGTPDYINCPMTKEEYQAFWAELVKAEEAEVHGFEDSGVFEGCMPVEVMARRGEDTLRFGPLKPRGLVDPKTGREPYAVVQLRRDNADGTIYNLVGFQTHLKWGEQKRVFSMIPALHDAQYLRYGVMHRNTYLDSPRLLDRYYRLKSDPRIAFAGQMTGVEGYVESCASGFLAGIELARRLKGQAPLDLPRETAIGALGLYVSNESVADFQPMNVNFGIIPPLDHRVKGKRNKNAELSQRSLAILDTMKEEVLSL